MKYPKKDVIYAFIILFITILLLFVLKLNPSYATKQQSIAFSFSQLIIFLIADLILIGIPVFLHWKYVKNYGKLKNIWFFVLCGSVLGVLLGEGANPVMLIPYAILMMIYSYFYKKFIWWKVALTSYLTGIILENVLNRAPLQITTLIWIPFFIYPYFITKIFENKKSLKTIWKDFKLILLFAVILALIAFLVSLNHPSPPLVLFAFVLPFIIKIIKDILKKLIYSKKH